MKSHFFSRSFFLFFSIVSMTQSTADANESCSRPRPIVYFANGMFNSREAAQESAEALSAFLVRHKMARDVLNPHSVQISYNTDENAWNQLLEVVEQKTKSEAANFFYNVGHLSSAPKSFAEKVRDIEKGILENQVSKNSDLATQIENYRDTLETDPILIVAHSQGNLFSNLAYRSLEKEQDLKGKLQIEAIANPSSFVAGEGTHTTLTSDGVIRPIPGSLSANATNPGSGIFDHEFIKNYLLGNVSGPLIAEKIKASLLKLDQHPEDYTTSNEVRGHYAEEIQPLWHWINERLEKTQRLKMSECLIARAFSEINQINAMTCQNRNRQNMKNAFLTCSEHLKDRRDSEGNAIEPQPVGGIPCPFREKPQGWEDYLIEGFPKIELHPECLNLDLKKLKTFVSGGDLAEAATLVDTITK